MCKMWKRHQVHEDAREMHRNGSTCQKTCQNMEKHLGGHDLVRTMDRPWRGSDLVQNTLGLCEAENGTKF